MFPAMRTLMALLLCCSGLLASGCDTSSPGGTGKSCSYGGKSYPSGDSFPSLDGCNQCACQQDGSVACTERACAPDGGAQVACPNVFPTFDRSCGDANGCVTVLHKIDCCGSMVALGISKAEEARFNTAEATCDAMYPRCGCPPRPIVTDSQETAVDRDSIQIECTKSACRTYVKNP